MALLDEVTQAAEEATDYLPAVGRVLTKVGGSSKGASITGSYEPGPDIPVRSDPVRRNTVEQVSRAGEQIDERTTHIVTVPAHTAVRGGDRVQIDGDTTYECLHVHTGTLEVTRRIEARTVPPGEAA